jgi:hypothetical protein
MRGLEILANKVAAGCMHASVRTIAKRYRVPEAEALAAMDCRLTPLDLQMRLHALQLELDRLDEGLKNFFAENGEKAVGRIYFLPASEDKGEQASILLSILASNDFAASAFTLLKAAMGNPSFRFVITAEFVGLSPEDVPTNRIPRISEFTHPDLLKRRAYSRMAADGQGQ